MLRIDEGIAETRITSWSKEFLEAGKRRLAGDMARSPTASEASLSDDDFSRYIIAWKLCTTMKVEDIADTLQLAFAA